MAADYLRAM